MLYLKFTNILLVVSLYNSFVLEFSLNIHYYYYYY